MTTPSGLRRLRACALTFACGAVAVSAAGKSGDAGYLSPVELMMERILRVMEDDLFRLFPHATLLLSDDKFDEVVRYVDAHVAARK